MEIITTRRAQISSMASFRSLKHSSQAWKGPAQQMLPLCHVGHILKIHENLLICFSVALLPAQPRLAPNAHPQPPTPTTPTPPQKSCFQMVIRNIPEMLRIVPCIKSDQSRYFLANICSCVLLTGTNCTRTNGENPVSRGWSGATPKYSRTFLVPCSTYPENLRKNRSCVIFRNCCQQTNKQSTETKT